MNFIFSAAPFNTDPAAIPGMGNLQVLIGYIAWGVSALCVMGLLFVGGKMAIELNDRGSTGKGLGKVIAACLLAGGASTLVGTLLGFNLFNSNPQAIPGLSAVQTVIGWIAWVAAAACLVGVLFVAAKLIAAINDGRNDAVKSLGQVAAGCVIVGSASTLVGLLL